MMWNSVITVRADTIGKCLCLQICILKLALLIRSGLKAPVKHIGVFNYPIHYQFLCIVKAKSQKMITFFSDINCKEMIKND